MRELGAKLQKFHQDKALIDKQIGELNKQIATVEPKIDSIDSSLSQSREISAGLEKEAEKRAQSILAEAEAVAASQRYQAELIEYEINALQKELDSYNPTVQNSIDPSPLKQTSTADKSITSVLIDNKPVPLIAESIYSMKLSLFVNARHFVTFGGKAGPVHAHSWQIELEVMVPQDSETVEFAAISHNVSEALKLFDDIVLNDIPPFNTIQPTTENIAMYFYNLIEDVLIRLELGLAKLILWETPTRGIQVSSRNAIFDSSFDTIKTEGIPQALQQAAATQEIVYREPGDRDKKKATAASDSKNTLLSQATAYPGYPMRQYLIGIVVISIFAFLVYHSILFAPMDQRYPWGSDTWAHLFKADYLYHEILKGNYFPQFTVYWYNGTQPFRYWAPLSYYFIALLQAITGDVFSAGNLYIFITALIGGLSCLCLARRMGFVPAMMLGLLWLIWLDNTRVAFSEGNFPRILATALLPLLFAMFMKVLDKQKPYYAIIATVILIHMVVLSHAMIGAIYFICLCWFALFLWIFGGCQMRDIIVGVGVLLVGIISSSWWLLPSLTGGITEIDPQSVKSMLEFMSPFISFNPLVRFTSPDTFYLGISLLVVTVISLLAWKSKPPWAKSLLVCGMLFMLITFPVVRNLYISLPLSNLLFPYRFSSFVGLGVMAAGLSFNLPEYRQRQLRSKYIIGLIIAILFSILLVDSIFSWKLFCHTVEKPSKYLQIADYIKKTPGWRVATIDLSQYGSAPSYTFSKVAGLEQVFGWAWQGAVTSSNIMLLNTGLEKQYYPFLFRSCINLGATDLVVKEDIVKNPSAFHEAAKQAGFMLTGSFPKVSVWHSCDMPYMLVKKPPCLVIGKYAGTVALQFPEVEMGLYNNIDQYSLKQLRQYPMVILTGAGWTSKTRSEKLITDYIVSGGKVIVDLAGMPENVLAKQPEFLGVYGEPVTLQGQVEILGKNSRYKLQPFYTDQGVWKAYVPMGLDKIEMAFSYYGNEAPIYGYKLVAGKKVYFLGCNLAFHSCQTGDRVALGLLKKLLGLNINYQGEQRIYLQNYQANEFGYNMNYHIDNTCKAVLPVAAIEGMKVLIDGKPVAKDMFENLLKLDLPVGNHRIEILLEKTPIYYWGMSFSILSILLMVIMLLYLKRKCEVIK